MRLFPSALHPSRDGFKKRCLFSWLVKSNYAAVEAGSFALGANRDTRRRRGCAGWCEGLSGLGSALDGRRRRWDSGHRIRDLSFAAVCSNDREADETDIVQ